MPGDAEADLIFALRPPFNADPGLRSRDPLGGIARCPFLVVTEGRRDGALCFTPDSEPPTGGAVYGCFSHLGKGVASQLGSRAVMATQHCCGSCGRPQVRARMSPRRITRSAPVAFEVTVADELRGGLDRLLSGVSPKVVDALAVAAGTQPAFMAPAGDRDASLHFYAAGPQLVRARRLRHGIKTTPVAAATYRRLVLDEIIVAVGHVELPSAHPARRQ